MDLKPCPFCGAKNLGQDKIKHRDIVTCYKCGTRHTLQTWNTRADGCSESPNAETCNVLVDTDQGVNLNKYDSVDQVFDNLDDGWHKWPDEKPELPFEWGVEYLVYTDDYDIEMCIFTSAGLWDHENYGFGINVTHWMELPAPPKEDA